ncbi:uncharacterized protein CLUP02_08023 [Colletotrichum lupini]|uniref:Uncharacterized protein n=1 Tax=Colletotrichum lupini TaxID=145971 RepID=A0A9Q8WH91_9PEZI|nr:uncharacterized protein CLUP02_08023 [Colletotrichum lupini]UQC82535.1 hypothetical protein CLUP02_08023 [Colletotrichum lupini]
MASHEQLFGPILCLSEASIFSPCIDTRSTNINDHISNKGSPNETQESEETITRATESTCLKCIIICSERATTWLWRLSTKVNEHQNLRVICGGAADQDSGDVDYKPNPAIQLNR